MGRVTTESASMDFSNGGQGVILDIGHEDKHSLCLKIRPILQPGSSAHDLLKEAIASETSCACLRRSQSRWYYSWASGHRVGLTPTPPPKVDMD